VAFFPGFTYFLPSFKGISCLGMHDYSGKITSNFSTGSPSKSSSNCLLFQESQNESPLPQLTKEESLNTA